MFSKKKITFFSITLVGIISITGAGFSAWFFGNDTVATNSNINALITSKDSFGTYKITSCPHWVVLEEGEKDINSLLDGVIFYKQHDTIDPVSGHKEYYKNDILSVTFVSNYKYSDYQTTLNLGMKVDITGYLANYICLVDQYRSHDVKGQVSNSGFISFGDFKPIEFIQDQAGQYIYQIDLPVRKLFRYKDRTKKPINLATYEALYDEIRKDKNEKDPNKKSKINVVCETRVRI